MIRNKLFKYHTILRGIRVAFTVLNDDGQDNLRLRQLCVDDLRTFFSWLSPLSPIRIVSMNYFCSLDFFILEN